MSQISCPICAKYTPISGFLKARPIQDITGAHMSGLGRGRGFTVTDRFSLLGDTHITNVIADRCQRTLNLIHGTSSISYMNILQNRDRWIKYAKDLKVRYDRLQARTREMEEYMAMGEEMEYLLKKINNAIGFEFMYLEDSIDFLLELVTLL